MARSRPVAIVGSNPATREAAPWDDPNTDIWVFNEAANAPWCRRADVVFQLHAPVIYRSPHNRSDPTHWAWLQAADPDLLVIYMQQPDPAVPASARYPLAEIVSALLGGFHQGAASGRGYFTSSVAYALALAIYQGRPRIRIYGVEMASNTEYNYQRDCVTFWIGLALGRGIRVEIAGGDGIFSRPLYGYEGSIETPPRDFQRRADELRGERAQARAAMDSAAKALTVSYDMPGLGDLIGVTADAATALGEIEGKLGEAERYGKKAADMWAQSGMAVIDRSEYEAASANATRSMNERAALVHRTAGRVDIWLDLWERTRKAEYRTTLATLIRAHLDAAHREGVARGVMQENNRLAGLIDEQIRAAGGDRAVAAITGG